MGRLPASLSNAVEHVAALVKARRAEVAAGACVAPIPSEDATVAVESTAVLGSWHAGEDESREHVDYIPRPRAKKLSPAASKSRDFAIARNVTHRAEVFGVRRFPSSEAFNEALALYSVHAYVAFSVNHSISRIAHNNKCTEDDAQRSTDVQISRSSTIIPPFISHATVVHKCKHGQTQPSRGKGERDSGVSSYTGCLAQLQSNAVFNFEEQRWYVQTSHENRTHNHECNLNVYTSYLNSSEIKDPVLRATAADMVGVSGNNRKILDRINRHMPFSRRQLENFTTYRLGGTGALNGLKFLLRKFTAFGYNILLVEDEAGITCGIALQTKAQAAIFDLWGDNLILDWTHNTNNVGYYMGSFLVTTASGKGVSVYDFLCLTQTKAMMRAVFEHFVNTNVSARDLVKSVVIDKDYREWQVLEAVFSTSVIVLCQFHVLKWFRFVVTQGKYSLSLGLREDVLRSLSIMVYAASKEDYEHQQQVLAGLLSAKRHQGFLRYVVDRWYTCAQMWANHLRGDIFTAWNTTSNRLESFWRQLKDLLGKKQRIDLCVEAIFIHATGVLTREQEILVQHSATLSRLNCAPFLEPLLRDLSAFCATLVLIQWSKYAGAVPGSYEIITSGNLLPSRPTDIVVRVTGSRPVDFSVDIEEWTCSCHFYSGSWLPCRHLFYVADAVCRKTHYPVGTLKPRWSLDRACQLLQLLQGALDELSCLRLDLLVPTSFDDTVDATDAGVGLPGFTLSAAPFLQKRRASAVTTKKLPRDEMSRHTVFNYFDKRQMVWTPFEAVAEFMTSLGTEPFRDCLVDFNETLDAFVQKWRSRPPVRTLRGQTCDQLPASEADLITPSARSPISKQKPSYLLAADTVWAHRVTVAADAEETTEDTGTCSGGLHTEDGVAEDVVESLCGAPAREIDDDNYTWHDEDAREEEVICEEDVPAMTTLTAAESWQRRSDAHLSDAHSLVDRLLSSDDSGAWSDTEVRSVLRRETSQQILRDAVFAGGRSGSFDALMAGLDCGVDEFIVPSLALTTHADDTSPTIGIAVVRAEKRKLHEDAGHIPGTPQQRHEVEDRFTKLVVPAVLRTGHVRTSSQSSHVTTKLNMDYENHKCPVDVDAFVLVLLYCRLPRATILVVQYPVLFDEASLLQREPTARLEFVYVVGRRLNFSVPAHVLSKLTAMILEHPPPRDVDLVRGTTNIQNREKELVVRFTPQIRGFTRTDIQELVEFAGAKEKLLWYREDLAWLVTEPYWSWSPTTTQAVQPPVDAMPDFFSPGSNPAYAHRDDQQDPFCSTLMRDELKERLQESSLQTTLSLPMPSVMIGLVQEPLKKTRIRVGDVVGRIARTAWMNDSVLNFALNMLAARFKGVVVIDSLNHGASVVPTAKMRSTRVVVFPISYDKVHWCSICVIFDWTTEVHVAFAYDPERFGSWEGRLKESWYAWCSALLIAWNERDERADQVDLTDHQVDLTEDPPVRSFGHVRLEVVTSPRQQDDHSCGVHVVLHVYQRMRLELPVNPAPQLTQFQTNLLRLRIMWLVVCQSYKSDDTGRTTDANVHAGVFADFYEAAQQQSTLGRRGKSNGKRKSRAVSVVDDSNSSDKDERSQRKATRKK